MYNTQVMGSGQLIGKVSQEIIQHWKQRNALHACVINCYSIGGDRKAEYGRLLMVRFLQIIHTVSTGDQLTFFGLPPNHFVAYQFLKLREDCFEWSILILLYCIGPLVR